MILEWTANSGIRRARGRQAAAFAVAVFCLVCALPLAAQERAETENHTAAGTQNGPRAVFLALEAAWNAHDADALAALVQVDGIRVTLSSGSDRVTEYGPSQSLYYFQGLFRSRETLDFRFVRMQDVSEGERAHGMATWRFRPQTPEQEQELRLVFLLTRQDDVWRLSEINKITVR